MHTYMKICIHAHKTTSVAGHDLESWFTYTHTYTHTYTYTSTCTSLHVHFKTPSLPELTVKQTHTHTHIQTYIKQKTRHHVVCLPEVCLPLYHDARMACVYVMRAIVSAALWASARVRVFKGTSL
jgi:hypothetical protein